MKVVDFPAHHNMFNSWNLFLETCHFFDWLFGGRVVSDNAVETPFTSGYSYGWSLGKILALQLILFTKITRKCEMPKIILKKNLLKTPNKSIRNGSGNGGYPAGCCHGELVLLVAASAPQDFWMDTRCVQRLINEWFNDPRKPWGRPPHPFTVLLASLSCHGRRGLASASIWNRRLCRFGWFGCRGHQPSGPAGIMPVRRPQSCHSFRKQRLLLDATRTRTMRWWKMWKRFPKHTGRMQEVEVCLQPSCPRFVCWHGM